MPQGHCTESSAARLRLQLCVMNVSKHGALSTKGAVISNDFCCAMLCKRDICRHAVRVCLSVHPSVCHVRGFCRNKRIFIFFHFRVATQFEFFP